MKRSTGTFGILGVVWVITDPNLVILENLRQIKIFANKALSDVGNMSHCMNEHWFLQFYAKNEQVIRRELILASDETSLLR